MKRLPVLVAFFGIVIAAVTACSNEQIYTAVQQNQQVSCQKEQQPIYEECIEQSSEPYEDYKKSRDDLLETE
ncbi:MAG: hypothetical protein V7708_12860 [Oceanicoccus sp.]